MFEWNKRDGFKLHKHLAEAKLKPDIISLVEWKPQQAEIKNHNWPEIEYMNDS